jgi:predicted GNAT superfamily acetyltransferase
MSLEVYKIDEFRNELNEYLKSKFGYKKSIAYCRGLNIYADRKKFDIMIRFFSYHSHRYPNTITIARIHFFEQKKGLGKDFLKFLIKSSNKYSYDNIVIESTNDNSAAFARKLGFNNIVVENKNSKDYVISINELKHNLKL